MRHRLEYALAWLIVKFLGALPRPLARAAGISLGWIIYLLHHRLRSVGIRNLALAYPEKSRREHARILRGVFTSLGRQLAEVCLFPKYTRENIAEVVVYDGFENFFGIPACTASGLARIALRTDAAVVPGFTIWDAKLQKYRLRFDPVVELIRTGNDEADIIANTQRFTKIIEDFVRRYPDQWLWVHRRWKTRPVGDPGLY